MFKLLKRLYYKRLFFRIYFIYLKRGNNPENAVNDAFEDIKAIKVVLNEKL